MRCNIQKLAAISITTGLKHQGKEKQIQSSTTASENKPSGPHGPRVPIVIAGGDDKVVPMLNPPSQHARVTVTRTIKVGELKYAYMEDPEGVATRDKYRQSTQKSGQTLSHGDGIQSRASVAIAVPRLGAMCEVTGQHKCKPDHSRDGAIDNIRAGSASESSRRCKHRDHDC